VPGHIISLSCCLPSTATEQRSKIRPHQFQGLPVTFVLVAGERLLVHQGIVEHIRAAEDDALEAKSAQWCGEAARDVAQATLRQQVWLHCWKQEDILVQV